LKFVNEFGCTTFVAMVMRIAYCWHATELNKMLEFAVTFFPLEASFGGSMGSAFRSLFFSCKGIF
jgi:hypothetical protein